MSSGLGKAIGLTSSSTWANIVNVINGIANRGTNQYAGDVGQGTDHIALNKIPVGTMALQMVHGLRRSVLLRVILVVPHPLRYCLVQHSRLLQD